MSQCIDGETRGSYTADFDPFLLDHFGSLRPHANSPENEEMPSELLEKRFDTFKLENDKADDVKLKPYDLNLLFYIAGSNANSLLKMNLCSNCEEFVNSNIVRHPRYQVYLEKLDKGGLHYPNASILDLVVSCALIYRKYEKYILRNKNNNRFIDKIVNDVDINFPACYCTTPTLKTKVVSLFFNMRSAAVTSLDTCRKRPKIMYGTATPKRRRIV